MAWHFGCLGSWFQIHTFDNLSIIPTLMGAFVIVGGWPALRWSAAPLGFLVFMLPLPTELQRMVLVRMQHWAAVMSNYVAANDRRRFVSGRRRWQYDSRRRKRNPT